jgi:5,10-methenyltetrahydrofolate synthetase
MAFYVSGPNSYGSSTLSAILKDFSGPFATENRKKIVFRPTESSWIPDNSVTNYFLEFVKNFKSVGAYVPESRFCEVEIDWLRNFAKQTKSWNLDFSLAKTFHGQELRFYKIESFDSLTRNTRLNIFEPTLSDAPHTETKPDLVLVPAWIVDNQFNRLGRGGGYYDKYISNSKMGSHKAVFIAMIHPEFFVEQIPTGLLQSHDAPVDGVLSAHFFITQPFNPYKTGDN